MSARSHQGSLRNRRNRAVQGDLAVQSASDANGEDVAVSVRGVTKTFVDKRSRRAAADTGGVKALDDLSLDVPSGSMTVLLGPSGCGKTTLLRSIAGLERPDEGDIRLLGRTVFSSVDDHEVPTEKRKLAMMFQSYALWPHMTIAQNLAYPLQRKRRRHIGPDLRRRIEDNLEQLGIGGLAERFPSELSGGQQQRVALARALIGEPSIILFDEPLSNVDAKVRRSLRALLRTLKDQHEFTGVYVTHDQEEAMELADKLVVMDAGKIAQEGRPADVYATPASRYVAEFVGESNTIPATCVRATDAHVEVDSVLGRRSVAYRGDSSPGQGGSLFVRPESIKVTVDANGATPDPASHVAEVIDVAFLGSHGEVLARLGEGANQVEIKCRVDAGDPIFAAIEHSGTRRIGVDIPATKLRWLPE